jgi:hypothetical protein
MDSPQPPPGQGAWPSPPGPPGPPPGPPPQQPQQPYGPPPWQPARPPYNGLAVAAFVTALVLLFPLALVLGLIALVRLTDGRSTQRGKGLAIAGVALAGVQIAVLAVVVPVAVINADDDGSGSADAAAPQEETPGDDPEPLAPTGPPDPTPTPAPDGESEDIDVYDIQVGDCFDSGAGLDQFEEDEATEESTVTRLACDEPHEAEAFGSTQVTGYEEFPGDAELTQLAFDECGQLVQPYVLDTWTLDSSVTFFFYYPQASSWAFGDREILCFFGHQDGSPLTASLRGDESELSAEQSRYLEITTPLEVLIWSEPLPDAPFTEHRTWAAEMARTLRDEADALAAESWPADISGLVDDLVAAREESADHWDGASDAADRAEYDARYGDGYATLGVETEISIRETLGLSTALQ